MWIAYLLLGLISGIAGGFFGIGGGIIIIPALVFLFGLTQHQAQGTTLAVLVPPIGLLAAWQYYLKGNVKLNIALFICLGFFIGGYYGAILADKVSEPMLKKIFGIFMLAISLKMILGK
jgi:uncharacterized protein